GAGGSIEGLTEIEPGEEEDAIHPSLDEELSGVAAAAADEPAADESGSPNPIGAEREGGGKSRRQYREPFEYGEILKSLDANLSDHEIAVRYYRELAIPHLIRFPVRETFEMTEPLAEGLETWDAGSPLESVDWFESAVVSPHVVPGFTTVQRTYGTSPGALPERRPLDLYLGIDCSGSMANPQRNLSYPVLAGTIIAVSALRAGAKVLATLSGEPGRSVSTDGFVSNESAVLELLTGYLGTGYAFGIHRLVETFRATKPPPRPVHILIITDHDIFSMLDQTYEGTGGWEIARRSLETAAGGGTYVLHMRRDWNDAQTARMTADGWHVSNVENLEDMVAFARGFSKENYARKVTPPGGKKAGV
ncbi:MAG: VWA domain-containing protein, partial [Pyrinomonadaceae bacterium]